MAKRRRAQLEIEFPPGWGGRRARAGRKPGPGPKRVPHISRPRLASRFPVHVTVRVQAGLPRLRGFKIARELRRAFVRTCNKDGFRICHFSIQGDHVHLLCEARDAGALSRGVQGWKVSVARRLNGLWGREGTFWYDRYHAEILKTPRQTRHGLCYVLQNGRKHEPGARMFELFGGIDPFSSAWYFDGWRDPGWRRRVLAPEHEDEPPVAEPRTWLLREGWRRHGLIRTAEVPGSRRRRAGRGRS